MDTERFGELKVLLEEALAASADRQGRDPEDGGITIGLGQAGLLADLAELAEDCPRGCSHLEDAPDCGLDERVAAGDAGSAGPARLVSYRRLATALRENNPWET